MMQERQSHTTNQAAKLSKSRPTIALLSNMLEDQYSRDMWAGVNDAARHYGANLLFVAGGVLNSPDAHRQANILYDRIPSDMLDGVLIWGAQLAHVVGAEEIHDFCRQFQPLPVVNIGLELPGVPGVVMDNTQGMSQVIAHLIQQHGYRRIAYIRNPIPNPETRARYQGYLNALEQHGIAADPRLIVSDWSPEFHEKDQAIGEAAIRVLLDGRSLRPQKDVEAIVAFNDLIASSMMRALWAKGIRVPDDMAVAGFDDLKDVRYTIPPLTTARQSFYDQGYQGFETLLALMRGESIAGRIRLTPQLIVRQSCGCADQGVVLAATGPDTQSLRADAQNIPVEREAVLTDMNHAAGEPVNMEKDWAERILGSFLTSLEKQQPEVFLTTWKDCLRQEAERTHSPIPWQNVISALRRRILPSLTTPQSVSLAEDLWHQMRYLSENMSRSSLARRAIRVAQQAKLLQEINDALMTTFDLPELMNVLARELPRLQIPRCYLALYDDPERPTEWATLSLAYDRSGRLSLKAEESRIPPGHVFPVGRAHGEERWSLAVEPLYFQAHQLGVLIFETGRQDNAMYEILRVQISSALQGATLVQRVREHAGEIIRKNYILDSFMSHVPDSIYFKDRDSRFMRANQALSKRLGADDPSELIGKTDFDFFSEDRAGPKYEQEQEILHSGKVVLNVEEADAEGRWALTSKMPLRDEHGEIIGTFGISRDITELKQAQKELVTYQKDLEELVRKRTAALEQTNTRLEQEVSERVQSEKALRVSEQQYRLLANNVLDGVVILQELKLLFANRVFASMLGYPSGELGNVELIALFHPPYQATARAQLLHRERQQAEESRWQAEMLTLNGRRIWVEIYQAPILWEQQSALLLTIHDISAHKQREMNLEQERTRLQQENITLKSTIKDRYKFGELVGKSSAMQHVYESIISAATSEVNALVWGESGTGKELIARLIHQISRRKSQPFVPVNCASIPETLFEREFFGHRKGAFTGADRDRPGLFDRAHQGVLFLDEVTELPAAMQAKLLRVLQDGEYTPLGSTLAKRADVLIVSATNKDVRELIEREQLRKDFFYRICVIELIVPPLRERKEDIPLLVEHFLDMYRRKQEQLKKDATLLPNGSLTLPGRTLEQLYAYDWPGNVRELQNVIQRYLATQKLDFFKITSDDPVLDSGKQAEEVSIPASATGETFRETMEAVERHVLNEALAAHHHKKRETAKALGMPLRTLYYKLDKYGIRH